jgi:hypothetical protein
MGQVGDVAGGCVREGRQAEMSQPSSGSSAEGSERDRWLVPDTGHDIVVSRCGDD